MSYYKKFITYIDVYEHNEKVKNIGFVKSEIRDDIWKLNIIIKGLPVTDTLMCELKAVDGEQHLERFQIINGSGNYTFIYNIKELLNGEVSFSDIKGLRFQLSANRYGLCRWEKQNQDQVIPVLISEKMVNNEAKLEAGALQFKGQEIEGTGLEGQEQKEQELREQELREQEFKGQEYRKEKRGGADFKAAEAKSAEPKAAETRAWEFKTKEAKETKTQEQEPKEPEKNVQDVALPDYKPENISSDKWQQLCRMYPVTHPFEDEEVGEFISLQPKDFVILSQKYQNLVNNSFLLHGFYNYKHILLGKKKAEKQFRYYIGVPGIFHDREKMVAVMFEFEAFEAVEKEIQGAFGYYMKEVEI